VSWNIDPSKENETTKPTGRYSTRKVKKWRNICKTRFAEIVLVTDYSFIYFSA